MPAIDNLVLDVIPNVSGLAGHHRYQGYQIKNEVTQIEIYANHLTLIVNDTNIPERCLEL